MGQFHEINAKMHEMLR